MTSLRSFADARSDEKALAERNARRAEEGLEPLTPGDKGKQGRVIQVFPAEGKVLARAST